MRSVLRDVRTVAAAKIDFEYKYKLNEFEIRMKRIEVIMNTLNPVWLCEESKQWIDPKALRILTFSKDRKNMPYRLTTKENMRITAAER